MKRCAALSWSARTEISAGGWAASTISSTEIASEPGRALKSWSAATEFSASGWRTSARSSGERTDELEDARAKKDPELSFRFNDFEPPQLLKEMTSSAAFRCVQAWLLEKPAVWAEADVASLAAALMVQRPPARAREDALLQVERLHYLHHIEYLEEEAAHRGALLGALERLCERSERNLALLLMAQEHAQLEDEANRETLRREALERCVEILEEENRNLRRRTH